MQSGRPGFAAPLSSTIPSPGKARTGARVRRRCGGVRSPSLSACNRGSDPSYGWFRQAADMLSIVRRLAMGGKQAGSRIIAKPLRPCATTTPGRSNPRCAAWHGVGRAASPSDSWFGRASSPSYGSRTATPRWPSHQSRTAGSFGNQLRTKPLGLKRSVGLKIGLVPIPAAVRASAPRLVCFFCFCAVCALSRPHSRKARRKML